MLPTKETSVKIDALKDFLRQEVRRFNMNYWGLAVKDINALSPLGKDEELKDQSGWEVSNRDIAMLKRQNPPCGTVCCFAGSVLIMANIIKPTFVDGQEVFGFNSIEASDKAAEYLELNTFQAKLIFYPVYWPAKFSKRLGALEPGTPEYVELACDRLDYFKQTGE